MAEHRRVNFAFTETDLGELIPEGATIHHVAATNNPVSLWILAEHPDWDTNPAGAEAPIEHVALANTVYEVCAEGNEQGECVLIDGHDNPEYSGFDQTQHINRYGIPWRIEMGSVRDEIAGLPTPGTDISNTPPRIGLHHSTVVQWTPCDRPYPHPSHWASTTGTTRTPTTITNCQGRDEHGTLKPAF